MTSAPTLGVHRAPIRKWIRVLSGGILWILWMSVMKPNPLDSTWGHGLLVLASLVIVPLGMDLVTKRVGSALVRRIWRAALLLQVPAALLLGMAYMMPQGG